MSVLLSISTVKFSLISIPSSVTMHVYVPACEVESGSSVKVLELFVVLNKSDDSSSLSGVSQANDS